jgi:1,2-diacylglycerol 3-beta-glucosyltransferase
MLNFGYFLAVLALMALIPVFLSCCYLFILSLSSIIPRWKRLPEKPSAKFAILIPAHNEEKVIEKVVADLLAGIEYDSALYEVIVIADNCKDSTSYLASFAGAQVLETSNDWKQGKGHALEWAFGQLKEQNFEAYLVTDVNTAVDKKALQLLDAAIAGGATAMQLSCSLSGVDKSWRDRYADVLLTGINYLRRRGRDSLKLSCGISGNGLCLTKELLEKVPFEAFTTVEGLEYHYKIVLAGEKVCFVPGSEVYCEPFSESKEAKKIFDEERFAIFRKYQPMLFKASLKGNISAIDCICDFYTPSLKTIFLGLIVIIFSGAMLFTAVIWRTDCDELLRISLLFMSMSVLGLFMIMSYIFTGMLERRVSIVSWVAVFCFPIYMISQIFIKFLGFFKRQNEK